MKSNVCSLAAGCLWMLIMAGDVGGAIIERDLHAPGDKLLTYDTVSGREWLDVTATYEMSHEEVQTLLSDGGSLAGFSIATYDDVVSFLTSAGFDPLQIPGEQDYDHSIAFVDIVSGVHASGGIMSNLWFTAGRVDGPAAGVTDEKVVVYAHGDQPPPGTVWTLTYKTWGAGINTSIFVSLPTVGYWIYRASAVPEPSVGALVIGLAIPFGWWRRRMIQER